MSTVLVTGAGGYIGTVLVEMLLERGHRVVGLDRYFFGRDVFEEYEGDDRFTLLQKDIRDVEVSDFEGVDVVCDLAALSNDPSGDLDPQLTRDINHMGRKHVAETAKAAGVGRYLLASSCSVYGHGRGRLVETAPANPLSEYAKANLSAENSAMALCDDDFCVTALRQSTVYGLSKRMRFDLVINIMTLHAVQNGVIHVLGGGTQWRPLVHIRDTARAFIVAMDAPKEKVCGEVFNVGSSEQNYQIMTIAYMVRENVPFQVQIDMAPSDADKRDYRVVFDKIRDVLGFKPEHTPEEAIMEIYEAVKFGRVDCGPRTSTVKWYAYLLEAERILSEVKLNGRLLS